MKTKKITKISNIFIFGIFFIQFFENLIYFKELNKNFNGGHQWLTADWLINYNFGFVRRGMFGSFLINLPYEYINIIFLIESILFITYLLTFFGIFYLSYENIEKSFLTIYLVSPLFLGFIFINKDASFRKEMLCVTTVTLLLIYSKSKNMLIYFATFLFYTLSIFSSEYGLMLFIPVCYLFFNNKNNFNIKDIVFSVTPPILYLILHFLNSKFYESRSLLICENVKNLNPFNYSNYICDGQIYWIGFTLKETINTTKTYYDFDYIFYYIIAFLIGLIPLFVSGWLRNNYKFILLQIPLVLMFFILATDWGRTLHLFFSLIYLIAIREIDKSNELKKILTVLVIIVLLFIQVDYWNPQDFNYFSLETLTLYRNGVLNFKDNFLFILNEILAFI